MPPEQANKEQYSYVGYGLGLCYRVLRIRADFQKLSIRRVQQAYVDHAYIMGYHA